MTTRALVSAREPVSAHEHEGDISDAFRMAMRTFTGIVSLVTASTAEGEWRGMAATAVAPVSMEPAICLVCVNRDSTLFPVVMSTRRFCINAMHQDQHALIQSFASSAHREARFQLGNWCPGWGAVPFLEKAQCNIFCEVFGSWPVGTHEVVLGQVVEVKVRDDHDPLLYGQGRYLRQAPR